MHNEWSTSQEAILLQVLQTPSDIHIETLCYQTFPCQHYVWYGKDKTKGKLVFGHHLERILRKNKLANIDYYKHFQPYKNFCTKEFYAS